MLFRSGVELDIENEIIPFGKSEVLKQGKDICLLAIGSMVAVAEEVAKELENLGVAAGVVNLRFAKPLDEELLINVAQNYKKLVVLEEGTVKGGVASSILEFLNEKNLLAEIKLLSLGIPDEFVTQGDKKHLFKDIGLDVASIIAKIQAL